MMSWAPITRERARATPACPAAMARGADDYRAEDTGGDCVGNRASRVLRFRYEKRDHEGTKAGCKARDRDQDSGAQGPLGRPRQARLDRDAHARQHREDEGGSHSFSLRFVVSPKRPDRGARRIIRGRRPFLWPWEVGKHVGLFFYCTEGG